MKSVIGIGARVARWAAITGLAACVAACGSGSNNKRATYTLGGSVTGLNGSLTLVSGLGDRITVTGNGPFTFTEQYRKGQRYHVTVESDPSNQTCVASNNFGKMPAANVGDVSVVCSDDVPALVTIGGTIQGLVGEVVLNWNVYADPQTFSSNGPFTFAEFGERGVAYDVAIESQPDGQVCSIANGFGTALASVTTIVVSCADANARFALRGGIAGLTGAGLRIEAGPGNSVEPAPGATTFALPVGLANAATYDVGIAAQPAGQTCLMQNASGRVDAADVEDISVTCIDNDTDPLSGTYVAAGLQPGSYVYVTFFPDGVYLYGSIEDNPGCTYATDLDTDGNGIEYGAYRYDATTHQLSVLNAVQDLNGQCGVWDSENGVARYNGALAVTGSGASTVLTLTPAAGGASIDLTPVPNVDGEIVGSWAAPYQKDVATFLPGGDHWLHYLMTETQGDDWPLQTGAEVGLEYACAAVDTLGGGRIQPDVWATCDAPRPGGPGTRDFNGRAGLWPMYDMGTFTVTGDTMTLNGVEYRRIRPQ